MRVIIMRHGESYNNILGMISREDYENKREFEPKMSEIGNQSCIQMGQKMKELGFEFSKILCSAHRRAILSAKLLREGFMGDESEGQPPIQLFVKAHEYQGVHMKGKTYPGLNMKEIKEIVPDISADPNHEISDEKGWFERESMETGDQLTERVKEVIRDLKEMHK